MREGEHTNPTHRKCHRVPHRGRCDSILNTPGTVLGRVPVTQLTEDRGDRDGKALEGGEVGEGRDRATLAQVFWGHSSGNPHVFCPCLPVFVGPTGMSPVPRPCFCGLWTPRRVGGPDLPTFVGAAAP